MPDEITELLASLNGAELAAANSWWEVFWYEHQRPPLSAQGGGDWTTWLLLGGRGAGKTHAGAAWVHGMALGKEPYAAQPVKRIALVGGTEAEVREVMIEGVSGLLAVPGPGERPNWIPSRGRLEWPNGAVAQAFSAEELTLLECPGFAAVLGHALWDGKAEVINGLANLSGLIITYIAARFGVLGVYVSGRTREKQTALTGGVVPSLVGEVVKAIGKRK